MDDVSLKDVLKASLAAQSKSEVSAQSEASAKSTASRLVLAAAKQQSVCPWVVAGSMLTAREIARGELNRNRRRKIASQNVSGEVIAKSAPLLKLATDPDGSADRASAEGEGGGGGGDAEVIDVETWTTSQPLSLRIPATSEGTAPAKTEGKAPAKTASSGGRCMPIEGQAEEDDDEVDDDDFDLTKYPNKCLTAVVDSPGFAWTRLHLVHKGCCYDPECVQAAREGRGDDDVAGRSGDLPSATQSAAVPGEGTALVKERTAYSRDTLLAIIMEYVGPAVNARASSIRDEDVEKALAPYVARANAADPAWTSRCRKLKGEANKRNSPAYVAALSAEGAEEGTSSLLDVQRVVQSLEKPNSPARLEILQAFNQCLASSGSAGEVVTGSRQHVVEAFIATQRAKWYKESKEAKCKASFDQRIFDDLLSRVLPSESDIPEYTFGSQWSPQYMCNNIGAFMSFNAFDGCHMKRPAQGVCLTTVTRDAGGMLHFEALSHLARGMESTYWTTSHRRFRASSLPGCDPPGHRTLVDGGKSLDAAIEAVPGHTRKARCHKHRQREARRKPRIMDQAARDVFDALVFTTEHGGRTVEQQLRSLRLSNPRAYAWITSVPEDEQFQIRSDDPVTGLGALCGIVNSNWAEIMMKVLLIIRSLPDVLMQQQVMVNWVALRHSSILQTIQSLMDRSTCGGKDYTPYAAAAIAPIWTKSRSLAVSSVDEAGGSCIVTSFSTTGVTYKVNLNSPTRRGVCECLKMLLQLWPCHHSMAAAEKLTGWNQSLLMAKWAAPCTVLQWRNQMGTVPFRPPTTAELSSRLHANRLSKSFPLRPMAPMISAPGHRPAGSSNANVEKRIKDAAERAQHESAEARTARVRKSAEEELCDAIPQESELQVRKQKCGICGKTGHKRRTCPVAAGLAASQSGA